MKWLALFFLLSSAVGCDRKGIRDAAALDSLLATGRIDRIEFLADEKHKTNVFVDEQAVATTAKLSATNRFVATRRFGRNESNGRVIFYSGTNSQRRGLAYIREFDALAFGQYYFGLKGTNELRALFFE